MGLAGPPPKPLPPAPTVVRGLGMEGCLIISAMGVNAAGELLPLFQLLRAYLLHKVFTWCLNTRAAMQRSALGHRRVESRWGKC